MRVFPQWVWKSQQAIWEFVVRSQKWAAGFCDRVGDIRQAQCGPSSSKSIILREWTDAAERAYAGNRPDRGERPAGEGVLGLMEFFGFKRDATQPDHLVNWWAVCHFFWGGWVPGASFACRERVSCARRHSPQDVVRAGRVPKRSADGATPASRELPGTPRAALVRSNVVQAIGRIWRGRPARTDMRKAPTA